MNGAGYFERSGLFDQMDADEIKLVMGKFEKISFQPGEYIFRENDRGDALYIVEEGSVSLQKLIINDYEKSLFVAYSGFIFGEFSFIDGGKRSASALANDNTILLGLDRKDFDELNRQYPAIGTKLYNNLLSTVTQRIRQTSEAYWGTIEKVIKNQKWINPDVA